jgi:hypothetical protein
VEVHKIATVIKLLLAVLLFLCLLDWSYGYFQLVRFCGMAGFIWLGYWSYQQSNQSAMIIYFLLAILFQPFIKISLGLELWNVVDVIVGAVLIVSLFIPPTNTSEKNDLQN